MFGNSVWKKKKQNLPTELINQKAFHYSMLKFFSMPLVEKH